MEQDRNFKVLVISDNYAGLDILNSILSLYYSVRIITSVDDALEFIKSADLDLIILDCAVLNCNCYDFFIKIKSLDMTKRIPIILIGDSSQPETEEIGFALGAVDYISKPFRSSIVKVRVNNQRMLIKHIRTIEKLGLPDSFLKFTMADGSKKIIEKSMPEHTVGVELILDNSSITWE